MRPNTTNRTATSILLCSLLLCILLAGCGGRVPETAGESAPRATTPVEQPADESRFSFIVCGDPQNNYEVFDRILEAAHSVDFLIVAGDLTGSGTPTEFENFRAALDASGVKYYCVPGNHDVATSPVTEAYTEFMGPPRQSFDHQNSHFVLIDNSTPELGFYPEEREWVASDLASARERGLEHIFAVCHVPPGYPYSAKASKSQLAGIEANDELVPVLVAGGAEELFCGHVHFYEEKEEDGLLITITGGAGAPLMNTVVGDSSYNYVVVEIDGRERVQRVVKL